MNFTVIRRKDFTAEEIERDLDRGVAVLMAIHNLRSRKQAERYSLLDFDEPND